MGDRVWKALTLLFLVWAILATSLYVNTLTQAKSMEKGTVKVNIGFKYGNGKMEWHNATLLPAGSTLLNATIAVADVNYTLYGMGAFVNSINGVKNEKPNYWIWWTWNPSTGWTLGPVAADKYVLSDGETVLWYYENTSKYPPEKP